MKKFKVLREALKIRTGQSDNTKKFMDEYHETTHPHPWDNKTRLIAKSDKEFVSVHASPHSDGVHIHDIQSHAQGSGAGTHALKHLTSLADKHKVKLDLNASGYHNTSTSKLKKWYKKHGFKSAGGDEMHYHPKAD